MKKILAVILALCLLPVVAMADGPQVTNAAVVYSANDRVVTITGEIIGAVSGQNSTVIVMKEGFTPSQANSSNTVFLDQIAINQDGSFEYSFVMPADAEQGAYVVYLGGTSIYSATSETFYTSAVDGTVTLGTFNFTENDDLLTVSASFYNYTYAPKTATLMIAQYDDDGRLVGITRNSWSIPASEIAVTRTVRTNLIESAAVKKAFAWGGGISSLLSLAEALSIEKTVTMQVPVRANIVSDYHDIVEREVVTVNVTGPESIVENLNFVYSQEYHIGAIDSGDYVFTVSLITPAGVELSQSTADIGITLAEKW